MRLTVLRILIAAVVVLAVAAGVASARLTQTRFDRIDAVYAVTEDINASGVPATAAGLRRLRAACAKLDDPKDRLLRSQRRVCDAGVAFLRASGSVTCKSDTACVKQLGTVIPALQRLVAASRQDNRVINGIERSRDCRKALRTSAGDLAGYETALRGFALMKEGIAEGSASRFNSGKALVAEIDVASEADSRKAFTRACKP